MVHQCEFLYLPKCCFSVLPAHNECKLEIVSMLVYVEDNGLHCALAEEKQHCFHSCGKPKSSGSAEIQI